MNCSIRYCAGCFSGLCLLMLAVLAIPSAAKAETYNAYAGAETKDQSVQADGFFPNEVWIFEGDSIKWTFAPKNEVHTVTLLMPGQVRPSAPPPAGPPFVAQGVNCTPAPTYDGSACVSTATGLSGGATFTVTFPKAGNYKLVCLVHTDMNGTVHVLANTAANAKLVHSPRYYEDLAADQASAILSDSDRQGDDRDDRDSHGWRGDDNTVIAGTGEIVATGGGTSYRAVVRFLPGVIRIHAGESVVWTNIDPTEPHTVTFGNEPDSLVPTLYALPPSLFLPVGPPIPNPPVPCSPPGIATNCVNPDTGTVLATINCTPTGPTAGTVPCDAAFKPQVDAANPPAFNKNSFLNSGFIGAQAPDRTGTVQLAPGTTRIRITFPNKGTYYYHCALHDVDGMYGTVIVQ